MTTRNGHAGSLGGQILFAAASLGEHGYGHMDRMERGTCINDEFDCMNGTFLNGYVKYTFFCYPQHLRWLYTRSKLLPDSACRNQYTDWNRLSVNILPRNPDQYTERGREKERVNRWKTQKPPIQNLITSKISNKKVGPKHSNSNCMPHRSQAIYPKTAHDGKKVQMRGTTATLLTT